MSIKLYIFDDARQITPWWSNIRHALVEFSYDYISRYALLAKNNGAYKTGRIPGSCYINNDRRIEFKSEEDAALFLLTWG